ncbi:uncharacterized protein LOC131149061 [Malania oleifera]|uniref:uncharacterized protein LOC131149061 n=1 Tax=Malania oleifera TaxID=397392 RepID=UPI0025AE7C10|nr:uncharacterized protein LOC131149061 [Malania oleifera]
MAGARAPVRLPVACRNFDEVVKCSDEPLTNEEGMVFGFFGEDEEPSGSSCSSGDRFDPGNSREEGDSDQNPCKENKAFWEAQGELLQATLSRASSFESRVRHATKEALRESELVGRRCVCRRSVAGGCRNCLQEEIADRLSRAGFNCTICKSKWKSSPHIPSGEHTFMEVMGANSSLKRGEVRVVIELNFRAEFEMARASEGYNRLISRLPKVFVGKAERLRALIKILCSAAKRCMKEKKMHMGPWRKHKYMQAKWLGTSEQATATPPPLAAGASDRPRKPKASVLTFDLRENLAAGVHCTPVEVV